ncbi:uncharacterized protein LOC119614814 [Lucilia sericata]|uniref:uncharacterized protein LOC119614814 n=1 Tax=Lucilia sericata TaxID=13632 RepID=UPI0018A85744|nr:uncharacterized protein LOC119614814 [Lucilia sericata]
METQNNKIVLLVAVLMIQLVQCNCNNNYYNEFVSKLRLKRDSIKQQKWSPNMSFHRSLHNLPENAIYCTGPITSETARYGFLRKYYLAIQGTPDSYVHSLKCIYPRSLEFPYLTDEKPLTSGDKLREALLWESKKFREFLDKVNRGEKPEPYKTIDIEAFTDDILNDIFHHKPDPLDALESSAPNGVICERLTFSETNTSGVVVDIKRPICYPAPRPLFPTTTTTTTTSPITRKYPTVTKSNDSKFVDKACQILCYTGLIYQLLACCK